MTNTYYRLVTTTTRRDGSVREWAHDPVTTIAGCKSVFTKKAKSIRESNEDSVSWRNEPPHYVSFTGRIEVCRSWELQMDLPIPDIKST